MNAQNSTQNLASRQIEARRVSTHIRDMAAPVLWANFAPDPISGLQNFTSGLVDEFQAVINSLRTDKGSLAGELEKTPINYTVVQSRHPEYFSVGGDLSFFKKCIESNDAAKLYEYSMRCLNLLHGWAAQNKDTMTSIALIQGRALGGGFEMALSTDYLIVEEQSTFGFPEIMFGLFPCTGAMGLLSDRIGARQAERMMTNKRIYKASELFDMGLVDEICARGEGELAVEQFIANHSSRMKARLKVQASRYRHAPLNHEEGVRIVDDWVSTAMNLSADELRALDMLIMMQQGDGKVARRLAA